MAKILQNLANNTPFGGVKEFYMAPLNKFLDSTRAKLNNFLEDLTRVESLDEHLQVNISSFKRRRIFFFLKLNNLFFLLNFFKK